MSPSSRGSVKCITVKCIAVKCIAVQYSKMQCNPVQCIAAEMQKAEASEDALGEKNVISATFLLYTYLNMCLCVDLIFILLIIKIFLFV